MALGAGCVIVLWTVPPDVAYGVGEYALRGRLRADNELTWCYRLGVAARICLRLGSYHGVVGQKQLEERKEALDRVHSLINVDSLFQ